MREESKKEGKSPTEETQTVVCKGEVRKVHLTALSPGARMVRQKRDEKVNEMKKKKNLWDGAKKLDRE